MDNRFTGHRRWLAGMSAAVALLATAGPAAAATELPGAQVIAWHDCRTGPGDPTGEQLASVGALCGQVTVPLDYGNPGGRTLSVAVARRGATDRAHRLGILMVNTGGPGPSRDGVVQLTHGAPAVAARYDLIGIDPRFFGVSTPLDCGWPTGLALRNAQVASPDRPAFDRSVAIAKDLAARCAAHRDVLPFASTRNMARDLDVVRAALGERKTSYLGWSFGTYLGSVYLQLFPGRTDRIVLDSALAPDANGPALTRETGPANAAALNAWASWAARYDTRYHLGDTAERVLSTVDSINQAAGGRPLRVGTFRIEAAMLPGLLLTPAVETDALYADFSARVGVLRDAARDGRATPTTELEELLTLYDNPGQVPELSSLSATNANQCADRPASRDPESYFRDIQAHRAAEPRYGPLSRDIGPCAFWPTSPAEAPTMIGNGHPALIVSAAGDPVTPYAGQQALHRALSGSHQITLDGAFRHGVYLSEPNACVDNPVGRYLLEGVLPGTDVTCAKPGS